MGTHPLLLQRSTWSRWCGPREGWRQQNGQPRQTCRLLTFCCDTCPVSPSMFPCRVSCLQNRLGLRDHTGLTPPGCRADQVERSARFTETIRDTLADLIELVVKKSSSSDRHLSTRLALAVESIAFCNTSPPRVRGSNRRLLATDTSIQCPRRTKSRDVRLFKPSA